METFTVLGFLLPFSVVLLLVLSVVFIVISTAKYKLHPFLALLIAGLGYGLLHGGMSLTAIIDALKEGFGRTVGGIGVVIVAGCIIGTFLEMSGGAVAIAKRVLKATGEKRVPLAMSIVGYIVSIPVFADAGFVILAPLNRALSKTAKISLAGSAIALALGLAVTHTLVPPTPGPIAAAEILKADLGRVILLGLPISMLTLVVAYFFATKIAARVFIDPSSGVSESEISVETKETPSALSALMPIFVPILLIVAKSIADYPTEPLGSGFLPAVLSFIGNPIIALLIGVVLAFRLPKRFDREMWSTTGWVGKGLINSAIIVLITGAGGAFGRVLYHSGIANTLESILSGVNLGIWLPFIIAAAIKTAQGSSTVSLLTTAGIIAPLMASLGFESDTAKALVVLAIGAGSLVVSHANDSFFWVLTQMSSMDVKTGYKLQSVGTFVVGCSAGFLIWITTLIML